MSPALKKILAVVLTLILSLLGGGGVAATTYGAAYATDWEGPQVGPILVYRSTVATLLGTLCAGFVPVTAGAGYLGYRLVRKNIGDDAPSPPTPAA